MNYLLIITFLLFSKAYAGFERGNGGPGFYCPKKNTVLLVDYVEAKNRNIPIDLGKGNFMDMVYQAIHRLQKLDPYKAKAYTILADHFWDEAIIFYDQDLTIIDDADIRYVPKGCQIVQLAQQKKSAVPEDPYYFIHGEMWKLMDKTNRAGLILHEIIQREAIARGHKSSTLTRYFNSKISSPDLIHLSHRDYFKLTDSIQLNTWVFNKTLFIHRALTLEEFQEECQYFGYQFSDSYHANLSLPNVDQSFFSPIYQIINQRQAPFWSPWWIDQPFGEKGNSQRMLSRRRFQFLNSNPKAKQQGFCFKKD